MVLNANFREGRSLQINFHALGSLSRVCYPFRWRGIEGTVSVIDISESKWIHRVIKYLLRNFVECLLNYFDYLVADSWVHSPCEGRSE